MQHICNPVRVNYRYQFQNSADVPGELKICREAADPSMIYFKGRYYIFASMTLGVWVSDDLVNWENHRLPDELPLYSYAPDVRVRGEWAYYCASAGWGVCDRWRTRDILNGPWEKIPGSFPFWDPNLFFDDDGRVYFYWGSSPDEPIWGVELDPVTLVPVCEKKGLVYGRPFEIGWERMGDDGRVMPEEAEEVYGRFLELARTEEDPMGSFTGPEQEMIQLVLDTRPFIEGVWMDKHCGKYYLQYSAPGTQFNTYSDGVYVSESPLGPFRLAGNNPYSYKPGGFMPGAGHGSTMQDRQGNWWHAATTVISVQHAFERRVGIWPAGFDADGELFCNQRYGDWPVAVSGLRQDPWRDPEWMLLSVRKKAEASSYLEGCGPEKGISENIREWWSPAEAASGDPRSEWLSVDLGRVFTVHAVQVNFADPKLRIKSPVDLGPDLYARYIDEKVYETQWKLEGSRNGADWFVIEDRTDAVTDLSHDLVVREEGFLARYIRIGGMKVPYGQLPCVSGLRVFGLGDGPVPGVPEYEAERISAVDMTVDIKEQDDTLGYNILFGSSPEKLYHSYMVFRAGEQRVGALIKGREYYVRVDAFNESGIREGTVRKVK